MWGWIILKVELVCWLKSGLTQLAPAFWALLSCSRFFGAPIDLKCQFFWLFNVDVNNSWFFKVQCGFQIWCSGLGDCRCNDFFEVGFEFDTSMFPIRGARWFWYSDNLFNNTWFGHGDKKLLWMQLETGGSYLQSGNSWATLIWLLGNFERHLIQF